MKSAEEGKLEPFIFTIFGATGDLTKRKLIPALFTLFKRNILRVPIVCVSRRHIDKEEFISLLNISKHIPEKNTRVLKEFLSHIHYVQLDLDCKPHPDYKKKMKDIDKSYGCNGNRVFYLALSPNLFEDALNTIKFNGMMHKEGLRRIVFEKPFGNNLRSAQELNASIYKFFSESEVYRIDHYFGKELVQNILAFRFSNPIFEEVWCGRFIDHVQITVSEDLGVEDRGDYYEHSGAIRDMIQNHIMQTLSLVAMEPPRNMGAEAVRSEISKVLKRIKAPRAEDIVLGQYKAGTVGGKKVVGYRSEKGVDFHSNTETFAAIRLAVDNKRWRGIPFYVRTGKRLHTRYAEVNIVLKDNSCRYFCDKNKLYSPNKIQMRIQPDETISVRFNAKTPGSKMQLHPVTMDFSHQSEFGTDTLGPYEILLNEIAEGDQSLFTHWDSVCASWKYIDAVRRLIREENKPLHLYSAGSAGPKEADLLIKKRTLGWIPYEQHN